MRFLSSLFALLILAGCQAAPIPPTSEIVLTEVTRVVEVPSPAERVEVTREILVEKQVMVTSTPNPARADDCFQTAVTQFEMNGCAALEYDLVLAELETVFGQIGFDPETQSMLAQIQSEWQAQMERDCNFFYGRLIEHADGSQSYENGSMAPGLVFMCKAEQTENRISLLRQVYLTR
jgi:uncharacterized protein YecT (DUF1311 family)